MNLFEYNLNHIKRLPQFEEKYPDRKIVKDDIILDSNNFMVKVKDVLEDFMIVESPSGNVDVLEGNWNLPNSSKSLAQSTFNNLQTRMREPIAFLEHIILKLPSDLKYEVMNFGDKAILKISRNYSELERKLPYLNDRIDYFSILITPYKRVYIDVAYFLYQTNLLQFMNKVFQSFTEKNKIQFFSVQRDKWNDFNKLYPAYNIQVKEITEKRFQSLLEKKYKV